MHYDCHQLVPANCNDKSSSNTTSDCVELFALMGPIQLVTLSQLGVHWLLPRVWVNMLVVWSKDDMSLGYLS